MSKPEKVITINTETEPSAGFERIMRGVDLLANPVRQTLGPYGRNFLLEKGLKVTNDGLNVAREIQAKDEIEDLGVRIVREAAMKTNEDAGDGTTTATVLTQAILKECQTYMATGTQFAKRSVISLKKQIEKECQEVIEKLQSKSEPIESKEKLIEAARVSVEDEDLAKMIGEAQWELGKDGMIIAEENPEPVCTIESVHGIRIDNGLGTSMVMNDQEKQRLVLNDVPVLLTNYTISTLAPLSEVIQALVNQDKTDIVIVARAFSQEAILQFMENHKRGIKLYPMNAPYVNQREVMKDLESVLGGMYIHDEETSLSSVRIDSFGTAKKVIGYRYSAIFTGDKDSTERITKIREELKGEPSKFNRKMIEQRLSQLENGFALLKIGSLSDSDRKYKYDKAEDAVNAVRSAYQEGTVKGAGLAMKEIADEMPDDSILKKPLTAPYEQIVKNAGGEFEIEPWVRNSLKVERCALQNACVVAANLITAGGAIATEKIPTIDQLLKK